MKISLTDAGKRFNRDWIFRHFTYTFETGNAYAITGPNGSGKSTLLQALSGSMMINEGSIQFSAPNSNKTISSESVYRQVSICAPYLDVVEEMTLKEFLVFHEGFKAFLPGITPDEIVRILSLEKAINKQIRFFSSGMKQRVKLAQCILANTSIVLLDEPCTNLDTTGIELYQRLIHDHCKERLVVVSSNDPVEYGFCKEKISMGDFKNTR